MNDQNTKRILEKAFTPLPTIVDDRIRETIANTKPQKGSRLHGVIPRLVLVLLLLLPISMAAVAAMHKIGVLYFTQSNTVEAYYVTLPGANELVQKDLAVIERPNVIVRVEEAAYDGRRLQIVYSITRKNAAAPFDPQAAERGEYTYDTQANGNMGPCDWLVVNDVKVQLCYLEIAPGDEKGKILYFVDSDLYPTWNAQPLRPTEEMTVGLPIEWMETGARVPDGLTFTMNAGDATARYSLKLPEPVEARGCRIQFTDLHFSPIQVSIAYTITIPAAMAAGKNDMELDPLISSFAHGILENDRGERLGHGKDGPVYGPINRMENGDLLVEAYGNLTPSDQYTKVIYLITEGGDKLPIPMEPAGI